LWLSSKDIERITDYKQSTVSTKIKQAKERGIPVKEKTVKSVKHYEISALKHVFPDHYHLLEKEAVKKAIAAKKLGDPLAGLEGLVEREEVEEVRELEEFTELMRVKMNLAIDPDVLLLYAIFKQKGFAGTLSDFINASVKAYMESHGYVVIVATPEES